MTRLPPEFYWSDERKLASLATTLRLRLRPFMERLRADGWQPRIWYGWRSLDTQRTLVAAGVSKTLSSRHCVGSEGQAEAVDLVDRRYGWGEHPDPRATPQLRQQHRDRAVAFFHLVGEWAHAEGLEWGGDWPPLDATTGLGWDAAHVQLPYRAAKP